MFLHLFQTISHFYFCFISEILCKKSARNFSRDIISSSIFFWGVWQAFSIYEHLILTFLIITFFFVLSSSIFGEKMPTFALSFASHCWNNIEFPQPGQKTNFPFIFTKLKICPHFGHWFKHRGQKAEPIFSITIGALQNSHCMFRLSCSFLADSPTIISSIKFLREISMANDSLNIILPSIKTKIL